MDLISIIRKKRQTLFSFFLVFLIIGLVIILTQTFKYDTKSKILVIQEGAGRVDPFSVSRSVEYLSDLFSKVVYSNSFLEEVMASDFNIDESYFGDNSIKKIKKWKKTVSAKSVDDSGIVIISVYHKDNYQAMQIALAVNHVLITKHQNYHGLGSSVKISVIDQPVVSNYPTKPNLLYGLLIIVFSSLFFGLIYIYLFPEEEYDIHFFGNNNKKNKIKKIEKIENKVDDIKIKNVNPKIENNNIIDDKNKLIDKNSVQDNNVNSDDNYNNIKKSGDINSLFE